MRQSSSPPARIAPKNVAAFARKPDNAVREIEDRERRRFRPFIWTVNEDGAHSFLTAIAERQLKVLRLPPGVRKPVRACQAGTGPAPGSRALPEDDREIRRVRQNPQVPLRFRLRPQHRAGP